MTEPLTDAQNEPVGGLPESEETPQFDLNADQQLALTLMEEICAASGLDLKAVVRAVHAPYLEIEMEGKDAACTFGRFGQALDSLQFLTNLIVAHRVERDVRVLLDAADYRSRRTAVLRERAIELAEEVKLRNEEAELEPLPSHERRIIHSVLADDPGVSTYSEGDDPDRHVVISPKH